MRDENEIRGMFARFVEREDAFALDSTGIVAIEILTWVLEEQGVRTGDIESYLDYL